MRSSIIALAAAVLAGGAAPALAQDTPAAPPSAFTISGGATLTSDYRFRGISQTNKRFAIQGTFTVAHESGFYATVWGSSIDDYIADGGDAEVDLSGGFRKTFSGTTVDVGLLYYYYPGSSSLLRSAGGGSYNSDFFEPYASVAHTFGPLTAKVTANYAWKQAAVGLGSQIKGGGPKKDNLYVAGDLSAGIPHTPLAVSAHVGHNFGRSFLTGGYKGYTDWNVGATYTFKALTFGVSYVDTDKRFLSYPAGGGINRKIGSAGVVGSVGVAF